MFDDLRGRGFIDTDADFAGRLIVGAEPPQIDSPLQCALDDRVLPIADVDRDRIEIMRRQHVPAAALQAARQRRGRVRDARGDLPQAAGAVIDAVHRRHDRQQHLRRTDVGGGLFAADVLLAGLQRQAVGAAAAAVDADADQTAGQRSLEGRSGRDVGGVRAAIAHRHPNRCVEPTRNVGTEFSGRHQ